ncbi:hypothetical protein [Puia sp.]|jgi:hypothetical protein|uniref:hypothetical protein n=1 Tax=Puia sp. TaxID=2045100 RepID=UPI002F3FD2DF
MLNLSDKELDRFSKEAAQEYEPGDVLGPRSWDRLEVRMTQEFGRPGWNPIRHIRRFPFYYAPALLLLLGVTYYLIRPGVSSGSSPGGTAKTPTQKTSVQTQNSVSTDKATSTPATSSNTNSATANGQGNGKGADEKAATGGADGKDVVRGNAPKGNNAGANDAAHDAATNGVAAHGVATKTGNAGIHLTRGGRTANNNNNRGGRGRSGAGPGAASAAGMTGAGGAKGGAGMSGTTGPAAQSRELSLSTVQRPGSLGRRSVIGDSALRAFTSKSTAPTLIKKKGIYRINRNWQFGLLLAPDFTSVNSLAGDKAGSSIGLTVDYQFAPHWYLSTGILASRKNYAARNQDYHAPPGFYQNNGIYGNVSFVKGSFYMMEIPLNLRYDFSVAGNTLFFISAGSSSYLMTSENANLYWHHFNVEECNGVTHLGTHPNNLFSTVNLSAGVETGLSNSLSLVIAPYMKLPTRNLGLGQVQMNSVGINFVLKFSPVTSRKRR